MSDNILIDVGHITDFSFNIFAEGEFFTILETIIQDLKISWKSLQPPKKVYF